jgi:sugar phosphate isomerase/epimerase
LGARVRDAGLRLAYHNHDFELSEVEGRTGLAWLLDAAEPAALDVELDLAWVARAGGDPAATLRRWGDRTRLLHVKDLAPAGVAPDEDGWATVGQGTLPWPELLDLAREVGIRAWLLEHDRPADPGRTVREGCAYLRERRSRGG